MIDLNGATPIFRKQRSSFHPARILLLLTLIIGVLFVLRGYAQGEVKPLLMATPTPTRTLGSYAMEGEAHFAAGNLTAAIEAYQRAVQLEPNNGNLYAELARIQTYSSNTLTTDQEQIQRLAEAQESANRAVELLPDDSYVYAVRAFVRGWSAALAGEQRSAMLGEAEQDAVRALQLDNTNALALAYYAEILVDQFKLLQAQQYIKQALERDPSLMDVHRVNAYVLESGGYYEDAIAEYEAAAKITPNLTFLYIWIGVNYRTLGMKLLQPGEETNPQYMLALENFSKAVAINEQNGVRDPIPYIAIAKTYSQLGQFYAASLNIDKAVEYNPYSADVYGQLGIIYFKGKNYEGAIPALKCAVRGCTAQESCEVRGCDPTTDPEIVIEGMPLTNNTVVYYYTYGSVLAGMHRKSNGYCSEGMQVMKQVRDMYSADTTIMAIIEPSVQICQNYGYSLP